MADQRFDVFLCHNSEDKPAVIQIAEQLQQHNLKPWLDIWELRPGTTWQWELEHQIERIGAVAVFVGKAGIGPWQQEEIYAFLQEFIRRKCPVIPVLLPDVPQQPQLPIFLKNRMWVDFRVQQPAPIAQLIWGITGNRSSNFMEQSLAKNSIITLNSPKGFAFSEPFAEELRMLEDMANDINRTLEERAKIRITEDDLGSEKGIGYRKLQNLLRARKWQEADQETVDRMCEAMGREQEGWLTWRDIQNFPCADLRTINRLWTKFSKGNFGFSVQKQIWQKCGSPRIMTPLVGKSS